jgi:hypothetical protein
MPVSDELRSEAPHRDQPRKETWTRPEMHVLDGKAAEFTINFGGVDKGKFS